MVGRHDLSDREWAIIAPLLPNKPRGVPRVDDRRVIDGIFYILRNSAHGGAVARPAGALRAADDGLQPRQQLGAGGRVALGVRGAGREVPARAAPDRRLPRPRPAARRGRKQGGPDHAIGRSRGGLSTKIHAVVDRRGLPVRLALTPGQAADKTTAPELVAPLGRAGDVVADRGDCGRAVVEAVEAAGATAHIPSPSNIRIVRSVDPTRYRQRHQIERFFNRLKHFRGIARRDNTLARNFLAAVLIASSRLWLRHYESTS
jgi:transposase